MFLCIKLEKFYHGDIIIHKCVCLSAMVSVSDCFKVSSHAKYICTC